jgi:hypothetical protein
MKEILSEILKLAINAPSGHNAQPWRFVIKEESLFIYDIPDKDKILFNYKQRGSMIAHGALIENIFIIASKKGFRTNLELFPNNQEPNLIAKIDFKKDDHKYEYENLYPFILKRTTNRRPFKKITLKEIDKTALENFSKSIPNKEFEFVFFADKEVIKEVAGPFSAGDKVLFDNAFVHRDLFTNINWTIEEEKERKEGLYVGTKELSFLDKIILKYVFSNWKLIKKLNGKIGLLTKIAEKRESLYRKCSAIGLIVSEGNSSTDFVKSGRILQRLWLTATSLGLSFQPVSVGLMYLGQNIEKENPKELTTDQVEYVKKAYEKIKSVFHIEDKTPTFSFRLGYAGDPTASSLKKSPEIIYKD